MSEITIRPLSGPAELAVFNQLPYQLDDEYAGDLAARRRQPGWLWVAVRGEQLLARAGWWGHAHADTPLLMDVLDLDETRPDHHQIGVEVVRTGLAALGRSANPPDFLRFLPAGWREDPAEVARLRDRTAVLEALGGRLLVERLGLQWGPGGAVPAGPGRLSFRGPRDREELLDLLSRVLVDTLDAHSRADLAHRTSRDVATEQLDEEFPRYRGPRELWAVGCLGDGAPVGLVIPSRNDYHWIVAYLGVLPEHRGRGYSADLLDHATRVLAASGATAISASTDCGNHPMAAAFHRCGYPTTREEVDYTFTG